MTSEVDGLKTNEFLRRRKLRLQQVREQSKDIAKKIRQRAKVEKLRQVVELDARKQSEYLQRQERLVKQLQEYYSKGVKSLGASHKSASQINAQDEEVIKDISKQRGKEAVAELRNKRQKILDEQKKKLDRKLQARETANVLSREKSAVVINKVLSIQTEDKNDSNKDGEIKSNDNRDIAKTDMGTQWDLDEIPPEWEPHIPTLALPKDDNSVKESNNNIVDSVKSKRIDLFALSEEMPSSLRGGITQEERQPVKSSFTVVSEYLKNRDLRLREPVESSGRKMDDLQSLKQTIQRTRASKEVSGKQPTQDVETKRKEIKSTAQNSAVTRKPSVTIYNHSTRDIRDIPAAEPLVVRDIQSNDDAYSQAMKENNTDPVEKEHKKIQEIRSRVAMTKQNVEKEYKDTVTFLNSMPKDKGKKIVRTAYMDDQRQQMQKDIRQRKMQQEYRRIEKECSKHTCRNKTHSKSKCQSNGDFETTDFQYSWMPVPEGDGNLAIHTIPTTLKEGKSGNSVKFSKVDSYHEYRSRHKHTPPTKDTADRHVKGVVLQQESEKHMKTLVMDSSSDSESVSSDSSQNIRLEPRETSKPEDKLSDAERIIIYKILDSKVDKKKQSKLMKDIAKSLSELEKQSANRAVVQEQSKETNTKTITTASNVENRMSFEQLNEGIYKGVKENGDNISSLYFRDRDGETVEVTADELKHGRPCTCGKKVENPRDAGIPCPEWGSGGGGKESGDKASTARTQQVYECGCKMNASRNQHNRVIQPSNTASTSSFATATTDKIVNTLPDEGFIKLLDDGGQEAGKLYIGASGLLKNDAYEVVIQLRKKGDEKENKETDYKKTEENNVNKVITNEQSIAPIAEVSEPSSELTTNQEILVASASTVTEKLETKSKEQVVNMISEVIINQTPKETLTNIESIDNFHNAANEPMLVDKGVSTSFQDSFAIPANTPKVTDPRPATSTYTQTSMSSPSHRPVFFHMSSSTSTAYMSPPEMILPPFMRPDYRLTDEDIYDPRNYDMNNKVTEHTLDECTCRKCKHDKKLSGNVQASRHHRCRKESTVTPPNTVTSGASLEENYYSDQENVNAVPVCNKKTRCKCRKCSRLNNVDSGSTCQKPAQRLMSAKHSARNLVMVQACTSTGTSSNKYNRPSSKTKTNLKPIIKNYVDKLLVLNRESLKAVQVIDQECSSVTTPGSSIIDMPNNINQNKPSVGTKISLQQIAEILNQKHYTDKKSHRSEDSIYKSSEDRSRQHCTRRISRKKLPRKRTGHKLKTLNISKHLYSEKSNDIRQSESKPVSSSSTKTDCVKEQMMSKPCRKVRSKSSPTPRLAPQSNTTEKSPNSDVTHVYTSRNNKDSFSNFKQYNKSKPTNNYERKSLFVGDTSILQSNPSNLTSDSDHSLIKCNNVEIPMSISTQTRINAETEINYMKVAEDKLQNMEKIADLTEKCTQRLSNLAKVLEEVRKNKSLVYNQISSSDSTSDSDPKLDINTNDRPQVAQEPTNFTKTPDPVPPPGTKIIKENDVRPNRTLDVSEYIPFISDIPKPVAFKNLNADKGFNSSSSSSKKSNSPSPVLEWINNETPNKTRGKPPPALSRIHLKHMQDVAPHELSTVVEVDSPMSVKMKASRNDTKLPDSSNRDNNGNEMNNEGSLCSLPEVRGGNDNINDVVLVSKEDIRVPKQNQKILNTDSLDNTKLQMIDMNQFNEIMLKPFFSIQEYANQCNVGVLEDGSNLEDIVKDDQIHDEFSSLHSDASLPDVISELLKRNIISEPFKFDTGSNPNSTTVSSESTISVLALSRARQGKKKSNVLFQNKENIGETSDTLSISSNPDLENAFKKLGMGWASSTLKKTKERLALSSSSNTSSSSLSHFKVKSFNQDIPAIVSDSVSSVMNVSSQNKAVQRNVADGSKHVEQQTSLSNSMTVKEFLAKELAKKITFNKSRNDTEEEFMSLFETKMPEEMKLCSRVIREDNSIDNSASVRSGNNNRARTSTPVQLFKSTTFCSSSSSNVSNGLFSNAEDLSSVKGTSNSMKHSTSDKDDLVIPNFSLRMKKTSDCSKSD